MTPVSAPEDDLMTVLHMAEQLYQQDQSHAEKKQEHDAFRQAAAEMGLGDQYLRRVMEALQAKRNAAFQRTLARRRFLRRAGQATAGLVVLIFLVWAAGILLSDLARNRRLSPYPLPASAIRAITPPNPIVPPSAPVPVSAGMDLLRAVNAHDNTRFSVRWRRAWTRTPRRPVLPL